MRLRYKLTLFSLLIVLGPIIALGFVTTRLIDRAMARSAQETLEHDLEMAWTEYWSRGHQMRLGMLQAAAEPAVQDLVRRRDGTGLRDLMRAWKSRRPYVDLWLVTDPTGQVIARLNSNRTGDLFPLNGLVAASVERRTPLLSSEILLPRVLAGGNLTPSATGNGLVVVAVTPVFCDGSVCGLIITGDLVDGDPYVPNTLREKLHGHLQHVTVGGDLHGPIAFISRGRTVVATSLQQPQGNTALGDLLPREAMAQIEAGTPYRGKVTIRGVPFLMAIDPIRDGRGQVVGSLSIGLPEQHFWGLHRGAVRAMVVTLLLAMILAAGVATFLGARMARPLQELTAKAQAIAAGDLSVHVPTTGTDEIGELGRAFNRMAQRLQQSYGRLAEEQGKVMAAIEASRDPIWVSDVHRRIVMVNSALEELIGRPRDELLGQTCRYLFGARSRDGVSLCDTTCPFLHLNEASGGIEGWMPTASGKEAWVEISYGRVADRDGHLTGVVHIVHDLTERKEVERLKDEFVSMVSHELRTPLHHIKGFATTLLQTDVEWDAATQRDFLESINREADRLTNLVEKILHLSRLEVDGLPMEREWYQVNDLIGGALRRRNLTADRPVHLRLPSDLPALFVDGREIEVALMNLIENAMKYSEPGTPITLGVERRGDQVVFSVADQGVGIPPEHLEHVFERFYRVDGSGRHVPGTGLGLAICKRIVEAHGGRIWVDSTPGVGSCFYFSLPVPVISGQ